MKAIEVRDVIEADAKAVWELLGDFGGVASWNPFVGKLDVDGDGIGMVRTVHAAAGGVVTETLTLHDPQARRIRYDVELERGARSVADIRLEEGPGGQTTIVWQSIRDHELEPSQRDTIVSTLQSRIDALRDAIVSA